MTERFDCHYCKESLFGKKYLLREENPYCVKCYENLYSNTCEECKKPIGCDGKLVDTKEDVFVYQTASIELCPVCGVKLHFPRKGKS